MTPAQATELFLESLLTHGVYRSMPDFVSRVTALGEIDQKDPVDKIWKQIDPLSKIEEHVGFIAKIKKLNWNIEVRSEIVYIEMSPKIIYLTAEYALHIYDKDDKKDLCAKKKLRMPLFVFPYEGTQNDHRQEFLKKNNLTLSAALISFQCYWTIRKELLKLESYNPK